MPNVGSKPSQSVIGPDLRPRSSHGFVTVARKSPFIEYKPFCVKYVSLVWAFKHIYS